LSAAFRYRLIGKSINITQTDEKDKKVKRNVKSATIMTELIYFLTYNDVTVWNAIDVFNEIKDTHVKYVGIKDIGLSEEKIKKLHEVIKNAGKTSVLEVVSATEEDNMRSAKMGIKLGVDYLIGGTYVEKIAPMIRGTGVKYCPYVGRIVGHPCLLRGSVEEITKDAKTVEELDVDGIDLLAYRYNGDVRMLIKSVKKAIRIPIIVAGSINSVKRVHEVCELGVWGFTVGTAVFDKEFVPNGSLSDQINFILKETGKLG